MPTKLFGPDNPGNRNGRQKGTQNWWTATRDQLRQHTPNAMAALVAAVEAGDVAAIKLFFSITNPPTKASYPALPIDLNQSPRRIVDGIKQLLAVGAISSDHADSILALLERTQRLETGIALAAREIQQDATMLETVQTLAATAAAQGDIATLETAARSALPYLQARPQPEQPEPTATVSSEPYTPEELEAQEGRYDGWQKRFCNQPDTSEDGPHE